MRSVSSALSAWLDTTTAATLPRHLVTITPRTGSVVRWTDHHADLTITRPAWPGDPETPGSQTYYAGGEGTTNPIINFGQREEFAGTAIGSLDMTLKCGEAAVFNGVRLPLAATNRMLDGAVVKVERVFGESSIDTSLGAMHVFEGIVAEARPSSIAVELDIECGLAALNVEIPRKLYRPGCTNILFDTQCGLVKATYTASHVYVSTGGTTTSFPSQLTAATGYYNLGVVEFNANTTTVALRGVKRAVRDYSNTGGTITVDRPLPAAPVFGDTFDIYPGCRKNLTNPDGSDGDCKVKFASDNRARFRGCPYIPRQQRWISNIATVPEGGVLQMMLLSEEPEARPVPIVYGKTRVMGTPIDSVPIGTTNVWPLLTALCEGPIVGVDTVYFQDKAEAFAASPARTFRAGTRPTATSIPGRNITYPGIAIVSNVATSTTYKSLLTLEYEVRGILASTGGSAGDADPAKVALDILGRDPSTGAAKTEDPYGAQFKWPVVTTVGLDGSAASSLSRYVSQAGFWISLALTEGREAHDVLGEICEATNSEPLWKEGQLYIVPRADTVLGTFSPVIDVRYAFEAEDLIPDGGDKVRVTLEPETESYNIFPVTLRDRAPTGVTVDGTLAYQDATEEDPDPVDVALRGERRAGAVRLPAITSREHALKISRILAQRSVRTRQEIEFSTGFRFGRLEPLDLVTVTDALFPFTLQPFQVRSIKEDMKTGKITITGQEWTAGVNHATAHNTQSSDGAMPQWETYATETRIHQVAARNWAKGTMPAGDYYGVAWNGTFYVAVGSGSKCATSSNGVDWTAQTIPAGDYYAVAWNGTIFCAVGGNVCATSSNGTSWTAQTITGSYRAITWNGSIFAAVGVGSAASTSSNGTSWTARTIPTGSYYGITWNGSLFVAVGDGCSTSPDGITWTSRTIPASSVAVAWNGAIFCTVGGNSCATSPDGITWTARTIPSGLYYGLAWDGHVFCATGSNLYADSLDGLTWTTTAISLVVLQAVAWSGTRFTAVGLSNVSATTLMS